MRDGINRCGWCRLPIVDAEADLCSQACADAYWADTRARMTLPREVIASAAAKHAAGYDANGSPTDEWP